MSTDAMDTNNCSGGALNAALVGMLPLFVKEPFSDTPRLNVRELAEAMGNSHETIYKWLRTNRLMARNASRIVELANGQKNKQALTKFGRKPPVIEDLLRFVFA